MERRRLGRLQVSAVGLGCNNFGAVCDEKQTAEVVNIAIDAGINFFDTADVYGGTLSERYLGKALGGRRDEAIIATKFGNPLPDVAESGGQSARWIARAIEGSLERLGTDRIDLYQLHIPAGDAPIEETLEALDGLVKDGKVLEIGCSNFDGEMIDKSVAASGAGGFARWASAQNHYNLLSRQAESDVIPACERHGLGFLPYFPLASGFLTGKYRRGEQPAEDVRLGRMASERASMYLTDERFDVVEKMAGFAEQRGHTLLELAFSWLLAREVTSSVIAGATKPEQVKANAAAAGWKLTGEELAEIDRISPLG